MDGRTEYMAINQGPRRQGLDQQYATFLSELRGKSAAEVDRELAGLVDLLREASEAEDAAWFRIGVAITSHNTFLGYEVERIVDDDGEFESERLQPAPKGVQIDLRLTYPADANVDAESLRGALLSAFQQEVGTARNDGPSGGVLDRVKRLFGDAPPRTRPH